MMKTKMMTITRISGFAFTFHWKSFGWKLERRSIPYSELSKFSEVLAAGTAAALVPIKSITSRSNNEKFDYLSSDEPGPVCVRLLTTLKGVQQGKVKDQWGWLDQVPEPKEFTKTNGLETNGHTIDNLP